MITFQFHHYIKPEKIEAYKAAILIDAQESIKEEGILRFEVFQDEKDPTHFTLLEVYRDMAAREFHMQTPYLLQLKDTIQSQDMFSHGGEGQSYQLLFPDEIRK
jgi:(4S)-4-hydroxy-5-phosphonooxypentane-2,3-dione isomerase